MKTSDMVIGVGLIILGILFLFENFGYIAFDFADVWPVFVIMAGAGFWIGFLSPLLNLPLFGLEEMTFTFAYQFSLYSFKLGVINSLISYILFNLFTIYEKETLYAPKNCTRENSRCVNYYTSL